MSEQKTIKKNINYVIGLYADSVIDQQTHNFSYDIAKRIHSFLDTKASSDIQAMKERVINESQTPPTYKQHEPIETYTQKYENRAAKLPVYEELLKVLW